MNCRLCDSPDCRKFFSDERRSYFHCEKCGLIFVPASEHVSVEEEKRRYTLHENKPDHEGYVRFLSELVEIVCKETPARGRILDYGSGPHAVLTKLLKNKGYDSTAYDPLYNIGTGALVKTYDAVILSEVLEHLRDMRKELVNIQKAAGSAGKILIRTQCYPSLENFSGWWYKNDVTHVNFFSRQTITHCMAMLGRKKVRQQGTDIFIIDQ